MIFTIIITLLFILFTTLIYIYFFHIREKRGIKSTYSELSKIDTDWFISPDEIYKKYTNIVELIDLRYKKHPKRIFQIWLNSKGEEVCRMTYKEMALIVRGLAKNYFRKLKGKKVVIILQPGLEYNLCFLGLLYADAIPVPVYPPREYKKEIGTLVGIMNDCGSNVVVSSRMIYSKIMIAFLTISKKFKPGDYQWVQVPNFETLKKKFGKKKSLKRRKTLPNPEDLCYLQYTSGSTSKPKGVIISHKNLFRQMYFALRNNHPWYKDKRKKYTTGVAWVPAYHTTGLVLCVFCGFFTGKTTILFSPLTFLENPSIWIETLNRYEATYSVAPNFGFDLCVARVPDDIVKKYPIPKHTRIVCGAEAILPRTMRRFAKKFNFNNFSNSYGLTEFTLGASTSLDNKLTIIAFDRKLIEKGIVKKVDDDDENKIELVGNGSFFDVEGFKFAFIDTDLKEVEKDRVGEILLYDIGSKSSGYYKNPEQTKKTFEVAYTKANGEKSDPIFLRTGDLGFLYDNILFICGRIKDIIIIRGRNLYPHDIEKKITDCHPFNQPIGCIAFGVSNYKDVDVEQLVIVNEIRKENEGDDLNPVFQEIRSICSDCFHVIPSYVLLIKAGNLSRTASHKVARNPCKNLFLEDKLEVLEMKHYK